MLDSIILFSSSSFLPPLHRPKANWFTQSLGFDTTNIHVSISPNQFSIFDFFISIIFSRVERLTFAASLSWAAFASIIVCAHETRVVAFGIFGTCIAILSYLSFPIFDFAPSFSIFFYLIVVDWKIRFYHSHQLKFAFGCCCSWLGCRCLFFVSICRRQRRLRHVRNSFMRNSACSALHSASSEWEFNFRRFKILILAHLFSGTLIYNAIWIRENRMREHLASMLSADCSRRAANRNHLTSMISFHAAQASTQIAKRSHLRLQCMHFLILSPRRRA